MKIETKTYIWFDKQDKKTYHQLMKEKKLTYRSLGKQMSISHSYLHDLLSGHRPFTIEQFNHFQQLLGE